MILLKVQQKNLSTDTKMNTCKLCGLKQPLNLAGASIGLGILGNKLNFGGVVPDKVSTEFSSAGAVTSKFVSPAVNISAGGYLINRLRRLKHGL